MQVIVKFFTTLREITGIKEEQLVLHDSVTVNTVLDTLSKKYGVPFIEYLFDKGNVKPYLQILIDGKNINLHQGMETKLNEGNVLAILPPVGGG